MTPELRSGYFLEYGGQFGNQQRAMRQLALVVPIALRLIRREKIVSSWFGSLRSIFSSWSQTTR